ncbi:MAG: Fe-S cluster assembly protein SufD [Bacteroidales bacterium]
MPNTYTSLKNKLINAFERHKGQIMQNDPEALKDMRSEAMEVFHKQGFPDTQLEDWKNTDISAALSRDYAFLFETEPEKMNLDKIFKCKIQDLNTDQITLLNGWYIEDQKLKETDDGMIMGSLAAAMDKYPGLVASYFGKYADPQKNGLQALNTAFAQDGFFIYVPDNVTLDIPVQMVSIINWNKDLLVQTRNLVIMGKNSKLTLVHCDDSTNQQAIFKNSINEIHLGENATLDHYKLQNLNNQSSLINSSYFYQESNSKLSTNAITLNGGLIRNHTHVTLDGENAGADIYGAYLMDQKQHVDNQVFVDHARPNCYSNELFKGIMDEEASAVFNGHILVRQDAQKTNAYQNNHNILMTDTARANAKPFLEIYADDVKCSHGATIGQLDPEAIFYLRSRGICEANARLLMLYAFAAEVIRKVKIEPLRERVDEMIRQRLKGELHICETCALHCDGPGKEIIFEIDMDKV